MLLPLSSSCLLYFAPNPSKIEKCRAVSITRSQMMCKFSESVSETDEVICAEIDKDQNDQQGEEDRKAY